MHRYRLTRSAWVAMAVVAAVVSVLPRHAAADLPAEQVEFFEKKVRPVLVESCYSCHSHEAKKLRGKLYLDSRAGLLKGGETGPVVALGKPDASRFIEAVRYTNVDLEMPPKGKLPDKVIADLVKWIEMGAPWPGDDTPGTPPGSAPAPGSDGAKPDGIDIAKRMAEHWCWKPVQHGPAPTVRDAKWTRDDIDRFILAALEGKGLHPAPEADRRTLIRRLYFDIIGLPPTPEAVEAFEKDTSPDAYEKVVDALLRSEHFGERWGRHWLDLVRYAESRGHEFEPNVPDAFEYRDYVIRALNADVPYNQFVIEHIAGDLVKQPRLNPAAGYNESVLGTGFWFLGEWVHSPVDIRGEEAERFENEIDVMSKTFLGLTVACARCHDHKFDAITTKDFYALQGYLQSSTFRLARFETMQANGRIAAQLEALHREAQAKLPAVIAEAMKPGLATTSAYLLAARQVIQAGPLKDLLEPVAAKPTGDIVFEDFESGDYKRWTVTGTAFGDKPQTLKTIADYQGKINGIGTYFVNSHNIRGGGDVSGGDEHTGTMTSQPFNIDRDYITMLVGGGSFKDGTCIRLVIDGKPALIATGRNNNQMFPVAWDVRPYRGKAATIQIIDDKKGGWGNIGVDQIVFTNIAPAGDAQVASAPAKITDEAGWRARAAQVAKANKLDSDTLAAWTLAVVRAKGDADDPLHAFALVAHDKDATSRERIGALLQPAIERGKARQAKAAAALDRSDLIVDYAKASASQWLTDGYVFGSAPTQTGDLVLSNDPASPIDHVVTRGLAVADPAWDGLTIAPGNENEPVGLGRWVRAGRTIRTPTFEVKDGRVYYLVRGSCDIFAVVDSHRIISGPLHGETTREHKGSPDKFTWVGHTNLQRYIGHRIHIEITPKDGTNFALAMVAQGEQPGDPLDQPDAAVMNMLTAEGATDSLDAFAHRYEQLFTQAGASDAGIKDWLAQHTPLFAGDDGLASIKAAAAPLIAAKQKLVSEIKRPSRVAMAMLDGDSVNEYVFVRGKHTNIGPLVPRRNLEAFGGLTAPRAAQGSGRLDLAMQIASTDNPLTARVMVNRIWHHLFGQGIVPTVDDFGVLGQRPTHPELLDHLAYRFTNDGWSIKQMIRSIVLTSTYRMASRNDDPAVQKVATQVDPANNLLWRMRVKRLEGEVIRDTILACSGRLDRSMFGPSVPVYLTSFMEGRGRPGGGPLDGNGRRSIYTAIRRNFLPSMMLAFDMPVPYTTAGRRGVSNVPAQALILMNDPLVTQQAQLWAKRVLGKDAMTTEQRVNDLYLTAFCRHATADETAAALRFIDQQGEAYGLSADQRAGDVRPWTDLCHVLMNVKEFIFIK